ncbi:hypothetical protein ARMSODRAFT_1005178 [Armillaria solidipes]|uniref:Uncharacterized protein n=1 Tax=Armillaria solidipes TaxID=1076256 RepID=A0A2H3BV13_9AGAR|nr:hypothetical protein ARMSODRAFT_1005178 [Armillaria solidipes]
MSPEMTFFLFPSSSECRRGETRIACLSTRHLSPQATCSPKGLRFLVQIECLRHGQIVASNLWYGIFFPSHLGTPMSIFYGFRIRARSPALGGEGWYEHVLFNDYVASLRMDQGNSILPIVLVRLFPDPCLVGGRTTIELSDGDNRTSTGPYSLRFTSLTGPHLSPILSGNFPKPCVPTFTYGEDAPRRDRYYTGYYQYLTDASHQRTSHEILASCFDVKGALTGAPMKLSETYLRRHGMM